MLLSKVTWIKAPCFGLPSSRAADCTSGLWSEDVGAQVVAIRYNQTFLPPLPTGAKELRKPAGQGNIYSLLWKHKYICLELEGKGEIVP
jgi:hypothetical protein